MSIVSEGVLDLAHLAGELGELGVVELDEVVGDGTQVLIERGTELCESVTVASLRRALHLHEVALHAVDLLLAELSHERGNLVNHATIIFGLDRSLSEKLLGLLICAAQRLGQVVGNHIDVFFLKLSQEVCNLGQILIQGGGLCEHVKLLAILDAFNLGQVRLHGIDIVSLERCKVFGDLGEEELVFLILLIELARDLCEDAIESFLVYLREIEVISFTA